MTAEQMFEELGYICLKTSTSILYMNDDDYEHRSIKFYLKDCTFDAVTDYNYALSIDFSLFDAIQTQMKELGWVEEEQKIKEENNFGHYRYEILDIFIDNLAMYGKELCKCDEVDCSVCSFNNGRGSCRTKRNKWLNQPYENPTYQLTQFEFDLLNAYKNSGMRKCISNYGTLLEMYGKGHFKSIDTSTPIREILDNCEVVKDEKC